MNKTNNKTLLCRNIINNNYCNYGSKCVYAHNLTEQKALKERKIVFDLVDNKIKNKDYFKNIDLRKEPDLLRTLIELTKLCDKCNNNKCTGGLNCKYGSPNHKYLICKKDLEYGSCNEKLCTKNHMTNYGLKPIFIEDLNEQDNLSELSEESKDSYNEPIDECYMSIFE